jgi:hypothetical protein
LALSHLGSSAVIITTLSSDTTLEGKALNRFYETARRETLMAHAWHCAQKSAALTLIEIVDDTVPEWTYKYRVPEDCLMPQRVKWAGVRSPAGGQRVPYILRKDTESTTYSGATTYAADEYAESSSIWYRALRTTINDTPVSSASDWVTIASPTTPDSVPPEWLFCDVVDAELEYTMNLTDTRFYTPDLDNAIAAKMAFYVAPKITANDKVTRADMAQLWEFLIRQAQANDVLSEQRDPPMSSFEAVRIQAGWF